MNFRASVCNVLSSSPRGIALLSSPSSFYGALLDSCDSCSELTILGQTRNSSLLKLFYEACEYRSNEALQDAVAKGQALLVQQCYVNPAASQSLCEQLAGGIADYLGIAYRPTPQATAVGMRAAYQAPDTFARSPQYTRPQAPVLQGNEQPGQAVYESATHRTNNGALIALAAFGVALLGTFAFFLLRGTTHGAQEVPNLVGMTQKQAKSILEQGDFFELGDVTQKLSDAKGTDGEVISQTPKAGTEAEEGTQIDLVVSKRSKNGNTDGSGTSEPEPASTSDAKAGNVLEQANFDRDGDMLYYRLYTTSYASHLVARDLTTGESTPIYAITEDQSNHGLYNVLVGGNRVYFGIGTDTNGDERYDYGTICSVNKDGSDFQEICTQDTYGTFMKFYIMDNRLYYYRGGYVCSNSLTGDDERQETLVQDTEFFCMDGSLYLALADRTSFARVEDGERVPAWTTERWDDFTPAESCLIVQTRTSGGNALRWYDYATGEEVGYAELPTGGADLKGINSYGDDAVVIMQADSGSRTCAVYRTSPSGESSELWRGAGYALVWRPTVLGDRVFFNVVANESSHDTPCSVSVDGDDFRVEDSIMEHSGL